MVYQTDAPEGFYYYAGSPAAWVYLDPSTFTLPYSGSYGGSSSTTAFSVSHTNGGVAINGAASSAGVGISGSSTSSTGVRGVSGSGNGVLGTSSASTSTIAGVQGVSGSAGGSVGVLGTTTAGYGVLGTASASEGYGVTGRATDSYGVIGSSSTEVGVYGTTNSTDISSAGVQGVASSSSNGVRGDATASPGAGVYGRGSGTYGVYGTSNSSQGVYGNSTSSYGVYGNSSNNSGVYGATGAATTAGGAGVMGMGSSGGVGVQGQTTTGYGVRGIATASGGYAGYFTGNVQVVGTLAKSGGSFKIDHPLDPENQYLSHSFVESPDMMNVYNGNVTLNAQGEAVVELPDYFEAPNRDFRYQLTPISAAFTPYVKEKVRGNRFRVAGQPGAEVSWQVTGIRQDKWANQNRIPTAQPKETANRGKYLAPAAYGQSAERGIGYRPTEPAPSAAASSTPSR